MTLSAKWSAVTLFALTALGAGSIAFAGCTVTSGKVDDVEGGTITPGVDSSTPDPDAGGDSAVANKCPGNTKQTAVLINATCQAALEEECCMELTTFFNEPAPANADGNVYAKCIEDCSKALPDGGTPTPAEVQDCQEGKAGDNPAPPYGGICGSNATKVIVDAYDGIVACLKAGNKSHTACGG